jgi:hypothetical protein
MLNGQYTSFMGVDLIQQIGIINPVDLKPRRILLDTKQILQFLKVVQTLNIILMLLLIQNGLTGIVTLNEILKAPIIPQQPKLNNMIGKLIPLHRAIPIHIDLLKQLNEGEGDAHMLVLIVLVEVEVLEHDGEELLDGEAFLFLLEALFDGVHLLFVQHLHYVGLGHLVLLFGFFLLLHIY